MLIGGVSPLISPGAQFHPVLAAQDSLAAASALPAVSTVTKGAAASTATSPMNQTADTRPASSTAMHQQGSVQPAPDTLLVEELVSGYSTTIGGQKYSASVDLGQGEYTASVANLVGASATGNTEQVAETSLGLRIDALV